MWGGGGGGGAEGVLKVRKNCHVLFEWPLSNKQLGHKFDPTPLTIRKCLKNNIFLKFKRYLFLWTK